MVIRNAPRPDLPNRPVLLDGGMGRELQFRGVALSESIWSARGLIVAPDVVRQIHADYITAGADVITTNTYGLIVDDLAKIGIAEKFQTLNELACQLARRASDAAGRRVLVAGSLPPLRGSFRSRTNCCKRSEHGCARGSDRLGSGRPSFPRSAVGATVRGLPSKSRPTRTGAPCFLDCPTG